jgi:hypothetical protein
LLANDFAAIIAPTRERSMPTPTYEGGGLVIPVPPTTKSFATRLRQSMQEFEKQLKDNENFRMIAILGGKAYSVEHIAIRGSEMAVIDGPAEEVNRYRILCHINSLQLMLQVEPKQPHEKRRRIGFLWDEQPETQEAPPADEAAARPQPSTATSCLPPSPPL